jgi:hypothetical protein
MLPSSKARTAFLVLACQLMRLEQEGKAQGIQGKLDLFPIHKKSKIY